MPSFVMIHCGRKEKKTFIDCTFGLRSRCRGKWPSSDLSFLADMRQKIQFLLIHHSANKRNRMDLDLF